MLEFVLMMMLAIFVIGSIAAFKFIRWIWREMMTIRVIELDEQGRKIR